MRTCFECARADVVIGGFTQKNRRLGDQHAAARVQRNMLSDARPLAPNGRAALGKTVTKATIEFNVDDEYKNTDADPNCWNGQNCNETLPNCWRLDNDICDYVIALPFGKHPVEVSSAILIIFWTMFSMIICACVCIFIGVLQRLAANLLTGALPPRAPAPQTRHHVALPPPSSAHASAPLPHRAELSAALRVGRGP